MIPVANIAKYLTGDNPGPAWLLGDSWIFQKVPRTVTTAFTEAKKNFWLVI